MALSVLLILTFLIPSFLYSPNIVSAAINEQINYQGKLLDSASSPVADGNYSIAFSLYTVPAGGTNIWTETNSVSVTSGLFSVMLGSSTALSVVDFNQTLYLGINVAADGEMTPRKILGTVPAAFEANNAQTLDNIATSSFLRSDQADTISAGTEASTLLTITQSGTGDILNLFDGATEVFSVIDGGNVGIGTSSPQSRLHINGGVGVLSTGLTFGDGDTGFYESIDDTLYVTIGGTNRWFINGQGIANISNINGPIMLQETTSLTNPTFAPNRSDFTTGIGSDTNGGLALIASGNTALFASSSGNIGIGTTTPSAKLQVQGDLYVTGAFKDSTNSAGTNGYVLQTNGSGTSWVATSTLGFLSNLTSSNFTDLSDTQSSLTANRVLFTNAGGTALTDASGFTFSGTELSVDGSINIAANNLGYEIEGSRVLYSSTTNQSVTVGGGAGVALLSDGFNNTAIGYEALSLATSSDSDTAVGRRAGYNSQGGVSTYIGYNSGYNSIGSRVTAIGADSASGNTGIRITAVGYQALFNNTDAWAVAIGEFAGRDNTGNLIAIGAGAGRNNTGDIVAVGSSAGYGNAGASVVAIGNGTAYGNTGGYVTAVGNSALRYTNAASSVALGYQAGYGNSAQRKDISNSLFLGYRAGYTIATSSNNILIGFQAGDSLTTGSNNLIIGYDVEAPSNTASNQLNIGNLIFGTGIDGVGTTLSSGGVGIGTTTPSSKLQVQGDLYVTGAFKDSTNSAGTNGYVLQTTNTGTAWVATSSLGFGANGASDFVSLADTQSSLTANRVLFTNAGGTAVTDASGFTFSGTELSVDGSINIAANNLGYEIGGNRVLYSSTTNSLLAVGYQAGTAILSGGNSNTAVGTQALKFATSSDSNTAVGFRSLYVNTTGYRNTSIGASTMVANTTGLGNAAFGFQSLSANTTASNNSAFGMYSLLTNTTGYDNVALGHSALRLNNIGYKNTAVGRSALYSNVDGRYNTVLGFQAGYDVVSVAGTGANTLLGYNTGRGVTTGVNNTIIGANVTGLSATLSNNIIIADGQGNQRINVGSTGNVGIGDIAPNSKLDVAGDINISDTTTGYKIGDSRVLYASSTNSSTLTGIGAGVALLSDGLYNTAIGYNALNTATSTDFNTAIGYGSGNGDADSSVTSVGYLAGNGSVGGSATLIGRQAGYNATNVDRVTAVGFQAGYANAGTRSIAIGYQALINNVGTFTTAVGETAGKSNTGNLSVFIGGSSGNTNTGASVTAVGYATAQDNTGNYLTSIGNNALRYTNAASSVALGYQAGYGNSAQRKDISNSLFLGYRAGYAIATSSNNILIGFQAGDSLTTGSSNLIIGYDVEAPSNTASNQLNIGNLIFGTGIDGIGTTLSSGGIGIGTTTGSTARLSIQTTGTTDALNIFETGGNEIFTVLENGNVGIGDTAPSSKLDVAGDVNISDTTTGYKLGDSIVLYASSTNSSTLAGIGAGASLLSGGLYNTAIGQGSLNTATSSSYNVAVGFQSLLNNTTGTRNTGVGASSLLSNTSGFANVAIGDSTLKLNTTGNYNTAVGRSALYSNTTALGNVALGGDALGLTTTGSNNTVVGNSALYNNITGTYNVAFGQKSGRYLTDGTSAASTTDYSIFFGANTKALTDNDQNSIVIGYNANGLGSNTVVLGNDSITTTALKGNVGIGTTSPGSRLTILGSGGGLAVRDSDDVNDFFTVRTDLSNAYLTLKDAGATSVYLTTTNAGNYIMASGGLGIGTTTPSAKLTVSGTGTGTNSLFKIENGGSTILFDLLENGSISLGSSTATTTILGGFDVNNGAINYDWANNVTSIERLNLGNIEFQADAGWVTWVDLAVTASSSAGTVAAYSAQIDASQLLTLYSQADGSGGIRRTRLVVGEASSTVLASANIPSGSLLVANGALCVDNGAAGNCDNAALTPGQIYAKSTSITAVDLAELYPTKDTSLSAGYVVSLDTANEIFVKKAVQGASTTNTFAGVISTNPGVLLGGFGDTGFTGEKMVPVVLSGRVPVQVNGENGDIAVGDRIALSSVAGVGARATSSGMTVGVALQAFASTSPQQRIEVFIDQSYYYAPDEFYIADNGNIGIGTTSPNYKMQIVGDIAATAFINTSASSTKKNIEHLDDEAKGDLMDVIRSMNIATYNYKIETDENAPLRYGLIAEEAPSEVLSVKGDGVDIYQLASVAMVGVQNVDSGLTELLTLLDTGEINASSSEAMLALAAPTSVWSKLADLASRFVDGVLTLTGIKTDELCVGDVCVTEAEFRAMVEASTASVGSAGAGGTGGGSDTGTGNGGTTGGGDVGTGGATGGTGTTTPDGSGGGDTSTTTPDGSGGTDTASSTDPSSGGAEGGGGTASSTPPTGNAGGGSASTGGTDGGTGSTGTGGDTGGATTDDQTGGGTGSGDGSTGAGDTGGTDTGASSGVTGGTDTSDTGGGAPAGDPAV